MPAPNGPNGFTNQELMVIEAARHIQDGNVVLVGTGLPMVATTFAQKTHAPDLIYVVESGPIAPEVIPTPISVSDPKIMHRAVRLGAKREVLGCILQRGLVDIGFLGGARGFSAGYPMAISACGSTSPGMPSACLTAVWQKTGAQYQHEPKPLACAARSMFSTAAAKLCTAKSRSHRLRSSSGYWSMSSGFRQAITSTGADANCSTDSLAMAARVA